MAAFVQTGVILHGGKAQARTRACGGNRSVVVCAAGHVRKQHVKDADDVSRPSRNPHREPRKPEYHANVGSAIEALREDYPLMLQKEPCLEIFAENVVLTDGRSVYLSGRSAYASMLWTLRFHSQLLLRESRITIQSMYHDDAQQLLYVRWRLAALPRIPGWRTDAPMIIDGMSRYSFNEHGRIYKHDIDPSMRAGPSLKPVFERVLSLGVIQVGQPVGAGAGARYSRRIVQYRLQHRASVDESACRPDKRKDSILIERPEIAE
eukprot:CAMPEP_0185834902 /NCGR_PEP_ID=MMETSP1353-20130828/6539_1 /TAXON_ID=1077150 /ORGANISM="Erythrolobus australicus, Strain CCMP3124" /LENGTH=263 /DNA_ID=CAMNT_0028533429 /DNA_START=53 /DNA_END=844 /DNA_ORIENTATION=-